MSDTVIKVENLSKQYRLGLVGTGTLTHDLNRWWHQVRGKEDPYLKIGETNDRSTKGTSEYVWALKDINFEVKQGEVLGIIGKNGAGKSTLLKLLSRVTSPTIGAIKTKGRIASLLEVGTGFHPELTGRENIFLNGAILGMTKAEIKQKLDEIIDFSGTARYIDTPVKRYSSGMRVRLAFAVAAYLEPEILIVDEVLAVGDAEFQKKAIGKMQDVAKGGGRTVLFVSHNMEAVKNLCSRGLLISNGTVISDGNLEEVVEQYLHDNITSELRLEYFIDCRNDSLVQINSVKIINNHSSYAVFKNTDAIKFFVEVEIKVPFENLVLGVQVRTQDDIFLFVSYNTDTIENLAQLHGITGHKTVEFIIPSVFLNAGSYKCNFVLMEPNKQVYDRTEDIHFEISTIDSDHRKVLTKRRGNILSNFEWNELN